MEAYRNPSGSGAAVEGENGTVGQRWGAIQRKMVDLRLNQSYCNYLHCKGLVEFAWHWGLTESEQEEYRSNTTVSVVLASNSLR